VKKEKTIYYILLLCIAPLLFSCDALQKKRLNERITLKRSDKIPYGTYVAYENLKYIFPGAQIEVNKVSPSNYNSFTASHDYQIYADTVQESKADAQKTLYMIISPYFSPNIREYRALMRFIGRGNHVFISAQYWGREFCDSLKLDTRSPFSDSLWAATMKAW
jgi:hypothetical protein